MEITKTPQTNYQTTNMEYGHAWNTASSFSNSFTQSAPYKSLTNRRAVQAEQLPKDRNALALTHDPEHPCGIMSMSNVPTNTHGKFTNVRRDLYSNAQGLWSNASFNTPGATIDRGVGTYSNLQGAWARVGPSTFDATHGKGPWVNEWQTWQYEPATLRSLHDHRNVNPVDNWVPIEPIPQNQW
eukprot:GHVU01112222.1.p1 GENE.GHVU01112222.1~~GHVU01112222.1.p1  ORF type:complete len:184 (+),score=11.93 GHVU01112222.1:173-724(+)